MDDRPSSASRPAALLAGACLVFAFAATPAAAMDGAGISPEFTLHGFSDLTLRATSLRPDAGRTVRDDSFALGQFDLFMVSHLSDQISFLGEAVIESGEDGATVVDLERVFVATSWSDALRLSAGRTHTALDWWNTAYHHGALLQPMIQRPQALRFEDDGGILPVHSVGLELSGRAELKSGWQASYVAGLANGRGAIEDEVQNAGDLNRHKATTLQLALSHEGMGEVRFGASGYMDHIPAESGVPAREGEIRERIGGGHLYARNDLGELLAEGFLVRHDDGVSGRTFRHRAGFAVATLGAKRLRPYVAWDRLDAEPNDPFYNPGDVVDRTTGVIGLRFDVHPFELVRAEYRHETFTGGKSDGFTAQVAYSF